MVEAVIVLPVLGILLIGTLFVRKYYLAREQALALARRCAWEHSMNGCDPQRVPPGCEHALSREQDENGRKSAEAIIGRARSSSDTSKLDVFDDLPVVGSAMRSLLGATTAATVRIGVPVPWTERDQIFASGTFALACNERPRDVGQAMRSVLCRFVPMLACQGQAR